MSRIVISLPTRARPDKLVATLRATVPLISLPETRIFVSVDDDDPDTAAALDAAGFGEQVWVSVRPREDTLGEKWNRALSLPGDVYAIMADYTPFLTSAFDRKILDAAALFPDGIGVVYSRMANSSFPVMQALTKGLIDKLGWMYPPFFPFWFVDHWVDDVAKMIGRIVFSDVELSQGPAKLPTQELRELSFWATFFDVMRLYRRRQARQIIDSADFIEPDWRRELLRRNYPIVEFCSQAINDHVRSWAHDGADAASGGERYARTKTRAMALMQQELPALYEELSGKWKQAA